ncbi:fused MFS/spermidine synthase [Kitasatospora sp. NA04385]|uniref:spermidine synthase n=1 Tax=Kitasatospora sp. NA04385 TaxID=2742135 RepID=UPI001592635D|nr:fused MFS/spermidine synthase [Kitasatospora sp. NA04385]QKW23506.1 fused MFS/spermidine synthase [Kitasatospora sp. NA04385]
MSGIAADGADPRPVEREVALGTAKLMPDIDLDGGWLLTLDGTPQSYVDLQDPTHLEFEYVQRIAHLLDVAAAPGEPLDVLHLGGGALTLPRYLAATRPGSRQQVVELDGPLTEFIAEHLPWPFGIDVTVGDARAALASVAPAAVDVVVADVFRGSRTPAHLTSVEFVRLAAAALRPGGCYAANLADGPPLAFAKAQAATVAAVFAHVCLVAEPAVLRGRRYGNVLLIGSDAPLPAGELTRLLAADPFPARLTETPEQAAEPVTDATATDSPPPPSGAFSLG